MHSPKPRLQNQRQCHAQHPPGPRRNPKQVMSLLATNKQAEDNARHRNTKKDAAQAPEEDVTQAAPALSRMGSSPKYAFAISNTSASLFMRESSRQASFSGWACSVAVWAKREGLSGWVWPTFPSVLSFRCELGSSLTCRLSSLTTPLFSLSSCKGGVPSVPSVPLKPLVEGGLSGPKGLGPPAGMYFPCPS